LNTNPKTFAALNETINNNNARDVYLDCNYTFELGSDDAFKEGVVINRAVTVHGNGYTLDGNNAARIFTVTNNNVVFKDIVFVNGNATGYGGAIFGIRAEFTAINCTFNNNSAQMSDGAVSYGSAVNCTFNSNTAIFSGGALGHGSAVNCTFNSNTAIYSGGAMMEGSAENCTFISNTARDGGAIYGVNYIATDCQFINNTASEYGGAIYRSTANRCVFEGNKAKVWGDDIYKGSTLLSAIDVSTVYNVKRNLVVLLTSYGRAWANKKITVKVGSISKTLTTNSKGQVFVDISTLVPKTYTASIKFAGDANYKASSKSVEVIVNKATPKVVAPAKAFKLADKTKKYVITMKTNMNKPLKNVWVYIKVNGKTYSAKTLSNGKAVFKLTKLNKVGRFTAAITFKGNSYYNKLNKNVKIIVKK
jgi:predicted outer membrane repeat protein